MIRRLRAQHLFRLYVCVLCVLWVGGTLNIQLHDALYTHVVCADHGVVEHGAEVHAGAGDSDGLSLTAGDATDHGEACPMQGVPSFAPTVPSAVASAALLASLPTPTPLVDLAAPRSPPLAYAPKTSPPVAS